MHTVETPQGKGIVHDSLEEVLVSLRAVRRTQHDEHYLVTTQQFTERPFNLMDLVEMSEGHEVWPHIYTGDERLIIRDALQRQAHRKSTSEDKTMARMMLADLKPKQSDNRYLAAGQKIGRLAFGFALSH